MFFFKNAYNNFFIFFDKLLHLLINYFRNIFTLIISFFVIFISYFQEVCHVILDFLNSSTKSTLFYDNNDKYKFSSNMISENDLFAGYYRLLSVDNNIVLPYNCFIRFLITSVDVLHSWAVPSLGLKLDACPGRLNQTMVFMKREGFFYGQCSEICGVNHAFMPIVIESVDIESYVL